MMDHTELVKALRLCQFGECACGKCHYNTIKGDWCTEENHPEFFDCDDKLKLDAAAAIEELQSILTEADKKQAYQHDYICELVAEKEELQAETERLKAQLPKRGEWIEKNRRPRSSQFVCSECHRTAYDPQPTRDKAWRKRCRYAYCPNCGADMRKMEVQE